MKLLAPAGNMESLKMAIFNGADEVYLGINSFNARNNVESFTIDTLKQAVDFAHLFGVRVFLAINILFTDQELQSALDTVVKAYNMGVDAFIMQDLGLIELVSQNYPEIEIHASTQMGIHNLEGVNSLKKYNIKRVVLARETPLEEIKRIRKNSDIEIEYFVQGALCVSFSGNCYLSSYHLQGSGNRGKCKQLCRLPYSLKFNDKLVKKGYLLSAKDFNMIERLDQLKEAGVDSIKIEGRARRPYYVGAVTREYYNALHGKKANQQELALAFNRNYTQGYFNGNGEIISDIQSHIGINIGKVIRVNKGKKFNQVYISSKYNLSPKSVLKLFEGKTEKNVLTAFDIKESGKNEYLLTTTQTVENGLAVHLILDAKKEQDLINLVAKKDVEISLWLQQDKPITAVYKGEREVTVYGQTCQKATSLPITKEQLFNCFAKTPYFNPNVVIEADDGVFMPKSALNEFRRQVYQEIYNAITQTHYKNLQTIKVKTNLPVKSFNDFCVVQSFSQEFTAKNVIYSPETYCLEDVKEFVSKCLSQAKTPYLDAPNFALGKDVELIKNVVQNTNIGVVANNYYALGITEKTVIGAGLNVYNTVSVNALNYPSLSAESDIVENYKFPYMTLRHCPIKSHVGGSCEKCVYKDGYTYHTQDGKVMKLKRKKLSTCTFYLTD